MSCSFVWFILGLSIHRMKRKKDSAVSREVHTLKMEIQQIMKGRLHDTGLLVLYNFMIVNVRILLFIPESTV